MPSFRPVIRNQPEAKQFPESAGRRRRIRRSGVRDFRAFVKGNPDLVAAVDNALATMQRTERI